MILYLSEPGSVLRKSAGKYIVELNKNKIGEVPSEKLSALVLFSGAHITSPCMTSLLNSGIPVTWLSSTGKFFGRVELTNQVNIERQREQFRRSEDEKFCLEISRIFIRAKVKNSIVILKRYNRNLENTKVQINIDEINKVVNNIDKSQDILTLNGYEGYISKLYFQAIAELINDDFKFKGRSRQPPKDAYNSLLSFGYTLLMYEIYTVVVNRGLHPYLGFLHKIKRGHPALASDLIEEWRSVLIDSLVFNLIQRKIIKIEDFETSDTDGGIYLKKDKAKLFIQKFEERICKESKYKDDDNMSFRQVIDKQILLLIKSIEENNPYLYDAFYIR